MAKRDKIFWQSAVLNTHSYLYYFNRFMELAVSRFQWENLPETMNERYLEVTLFEQGAALVFEDDVMGLLGLSFVQSGQFDVYGETIRRRAYSRYNQYTKNCTNKDSVIVWNNFTRTNTLDVCKMFARRLYMIDRIIDVNINGQKTPLLLQGSEQQRLTLMNLYKEYDGNAPVIFGDRQIDFTRDGIKAIKTDVPFISDKLLAIKATLWNDALTDLGVSNISYNKKERLITDEVQRSMGGTVSSRYASLIARRQAVDKINSMFGTEIEVHYREDVEGTGKGEDEGFPEGSEDDE